MLTLKLLHKEDNTPIASETYKRKRGCNMQNISFLTDSRKTSTVSDNYNAFKQRSCLEGFSFMNCIWTLLLGIKL